MVRTAPKELEETDLKVTRFRRKKATPRGMKGNILSKSYDNEWLRSVQRTAWYGAWSQSIYSQPALSVIEKSAADRFRMFRN